MKIKKEDNQYYGSYFEQAIVSLINKEEITNKTEFPFSLSEIEELNSDAKKAVCTAFSLVHEAEHIGSETSARNGDILIQDKTVEIKYVAGGKGTHFNTSVNYTEEVFNYESMSSFMRRLGLYDKAQELFGHEYKVNVLGNSPLSQKDSSSLRHRSDLADAYMLYKEKEAELRAGYVSSFLAFLNESPDRAILFMSNMISKEASHKKIADQLVIFNHKTKNVTALTKEDISIRVNENPLRLSGKYSITNGEVRVTFSWQNGVGLNNPTLRVFLT